MRIGARSRARLTRRNTCFIASRPGLNGEFVARSLKRRHNVGQKTGERLRQRAGTRHQNIVVTRQPIKRQLRRGCRPEAPFGPIALDRAAYALFRRGEAGAGGLWSAVFLRSSRNLQGHRWGHPTEATGAAQEIRPASQPLDPQRCGSGPGRCLRRRASSGHGRAGAPAPCVPLQWPCGRESRGAASGPDGSADRCASRQISCFHGHFGERPSRRKAAGLSTRGPLRRMLMGRHAASAWRCTGRRSSASS